MEYLATGKVVVSNYFTMYEDVREIMAMMPTPDMNGFVEHFDSILSNLESHNSWDNQCRRMNFALSNTYAENAKRILEHLSGLPG